MTSVKVIAVGLFSLFLLLLGSAIGSGPTVAMSISLAMLPIISYIMGRRAMRDLDCRHEGPEFVHEDEPASMEVHLQGNGALLGTIEVKDKLPQWAEYSAESRQTVEYLPSEIVVSYVIVGRKRGVYQLGPLALRSSDPLGFFMFRKSWPLISRLVVLPRPLAVPDLHVRPMGRTGEHQYEGSGAKGSGIDFHGIREYQPGDELRRVHWRSTARYGTLSVIEFEHTKAEDAVLAIDLSQGSEIGEGRYSSLEYAVKIAAALAEDSMALGSSVRLACAGVEGIAATPGVGQAHLYSVLEALAGMHANRPETLSNVLASEMESLGDCSTVICISAAIDPDLPEYVKLLSARGIDLQFILITLSSTLRESTQRMALELAAAGARLTIVECSTITMQGQVKYSYE